MTSDPPSPSDEALARETQAGSMEAFEQLIFRYEKRIYSFIFQSCRNSSDATEITQEAFVRVFQSISQFDPKRTFAPWLFTIARRKCIDHLRALKRCPQHSTLDASDNNDSSFEASDTSDPAELLAQHDERRHLWTLARRILPQSQFDALWLHYVEDMSIAEVARVLRRPKTYIKVLLFRARKALAERLKPNHRNAGTSAEARPGLVHSKSVQTVYEITVH